MADYNIAHQLTHGLEGGEVNDPDDRGGHTIYGITKKIFKFYCKDSAYRGNFSDLTPGMAKEIGRNLYWNKIQGDNIHSQCVADEVYDSAFNHGPRGGIKLLQKSINVFYHTPRFKYKKKLKVDGIMGDVTRFAINEITSKYEIQFYRCINGERYLKFKIIVFLNPLQWKFFIGWMWRC